MDASLRVFLFDLAHRLGVNVDELFERFTLTELHDLHAATGLNR